MSLKREQGLRTRACLIEKAQKMFADKGFAKTRFDEIAKAQDLTTGALYHYFKNKAEIFEQVFKKCSKEVAIKVIESADAENDPVKSISAGCLTYIQESSAPEYKRIMLEDAISVLGWSKWKAVDAATSEQTLVEAIGEGQQAGVFRNDISQEALARFISGGTNELALWASNDSDGSFKMNASEGVLNVLLSNITEATKND